MWPRNNEGLIATHCIYLKYKCLSKVECESRKLSVNIDDCLAVREKAERVREVLQRREASQRKVNQRTEGKERGSKRHRITGCNIYYES